MPIRFRQAISPINTKQMSNIHTVFVKGQPVEFKSAFDSLAEAYRALAKVGESNPFASDLMAAARRRRLSPTQASWLHKLATDRAAPAKLGGLAPVIEMLLKAKAAQKRLPRIELSATDDDGQSQRVVIKLRKSTAYVGGASVTDGGPYGVSVLFGFISESGEYRPMRDNSAEVETLLCELAADPAKVAGQHGVATGNCSFCARLLSDKRSRFVGYGPTCADKFGLPWGEVAEDVQPARPAVWQDCEACDEHDQEVDCPACHGDTMVGGE